MKYSLRSIVLLLVIATMPVGEAMAETWQGITPLKSTRADVVWILGGNNYKGYDFFAHEEGKVQLYYGAGLKEGDCFARAPKDLVTSLSIELKYALKLKEAKVDFNQFERIVDAPFPTLVRYVDLKRGIEYRATAESDEVFQTFYYPSREDCNQF